MMTDRKYSIKINGLDAHITLTSTIQGIRAHTVVFDENGDIMAEPDACHYIDYCDREAVLAEVGAIIDFLDALDALDALNLVCNCDDD